LCVINKNYRSIFSFLNCSLAIFRAVFIKEKSSVRSAIDVIVFFQILKHFFAVYQISYFLNLRQGKSKV